MDTMLRDKDAIRDLVSHDCFHMDAGRFAVIGALFAEDGDRATAQSNYLVILETRNGPVPSVCG